MGEAEEGVRDCEFGRCDGAVHEWRAVFWEVSERRIQAKLVIFVKIPYCFSRRQSKQCRDCEARLPSHVILETFC